MSKIETLLDGYRQFHRQYFRTDDSLYKSLNIHGQRPKTLIIACSDSRLDPAIITQAAPGDIFVVRNVANLVPPFEGGNTGFHGVSAALEFGVRSLGVEHIVVLGHSHCGGINALISDSEGKETDFIGDWISLAAPAKKRALEKSQQNDQEPLLHICERESILHSMANLLTFPWIKEKVARGALQIHGWYFTITDGVLQEYNPDSEQFTPINVD